MANRALGLVAAHSILTLAVWLPSCKSDEPSGPAAPAPTPEPAPAEAAATEPGPTRLDGSPWPFGDDARLFDSPGDALEVILDLEPRILGIGEFHKLEGSKDVDSALRRFADEMIDVLGPKTAHLVLETWRVEPGCGKTGQKVEAKVKETIERPPETENEMDVLMKKSERYGIKGHVLSFACEEYEGLLGDQGLEHEKLLTLIAKKLGEAAVMAAQAENPTKPISILYGGSTHNDESPYAGLEGWSYAKTIKEVVGTGFVELDLYVPEFVEGNELLAQEAWYAELMKEARQGQVILIKRSATSYILLMRKGYKSS